MSFLERVAENTGDPIPEIDECHIPFIRKRDVSEVFAKRLSHIEQERPPAPPLHYEIFAN